MLRSLKDIESYQIVATDGFIGHVTDLYFDDDTWVVRFLVVDTGHWLPGRNVLISPISISLADWSRRELSLALTRDAVRDSPDINTQRPVSRQMETDYLEYYGYRSYWNGPGLWWGGIYPNTGYGYGGTEAAWTPRSPSRAMTDSYATAATMRHRHDDIHLRSCAELSGYHIHASDGDIGHVQGILFDDETWAVRFLVVNTSNWWMGHDVLIAPEWIEAMSWADASMTLNISRAAIKSAPPYVTDLEFDRSQELPIFSHYRRDGFWNSPSAGTKS